MRKNKIAVLFLVSALLFGCVLVSCTVYKPRREIEPPVQFPEKFSAGETGEETPDRWWEAFGDAQLNSIVESALADNLDLLQAWARLDQAAAIAKQAGAGDWPQLNLEAGASRSRAIVSSPMLPDAGASTSNMFSLNLSAAYEIDLWGRVRAAKKAAALDFAGNSEDVAASVLSLSAQVVDLWFSILESKSDLGLLERQAEVNKTYVELVELRFSNGLGSALEIYQQRQQLAATLAQVPRAESRLSVMRRRLAVLLGRPPNESVFEPSGVLPAMPPPPVIGLPVDLLHRRPDVEAARLRVAAADYRAAAALADRLPAIRLTGRAGYQNDDLSDLFDSWIWNLAGNILAPIFDGYRRSAEVERAEAVVREKLFAYGKVVLEACREVEDALVRERKQREYLTALDRQLQLARSTLTEAQMRYINGLNDYLHVLTALQSLQRLERERLAARKTLLSFRIELYKALGGKWEAKTRPSETG